MKFFYPELATSSDLGTGINVTSSVDVFDMYPTSDEDNNVGELNSNCSIVNVINVEIARLISYGVHLDKNADLIKFYVDNKQSYPLLYNLICSNLGIPAGNLPSERSNKVARDVFQNRETLSDEVFKCEIIVDSFLRLFKNISKQPPKDYSAAAALVLAKYNSQSNAKSREHWIKNDIVLQHAVKYRILKEVTANVRFEYLELVSVNGISVIPVVDNSVVHNVDDGNNLFF